MKCSKCGTDVGDSKFCPECGAKIEVDNDGEKVESKDTTNNPLINPKPEDSQEKDESLTSKKSSGNKKTLIVFALLFVIILIVCFFIKGIVNKKGKDDASIDDNTISVADTSTSEDVIEPAVKVHDTILTMKQNMKTDANAANMDLCSFFGIIDNNSEKTIEHITFTLNIYNKDGYEKGETSFKIDTIIEPGESTLPLDKDGKFYYWKKNDYFSPSFKNIAIEHQYIVDLNSVKITEIEIKYSDNTSEKIECDDSIDEIYYQAAMWDVFYYVERDESGRVIKQMSCPIGEMDVHQYLDIPYIYPVK